METWFSQKKLLFWDISDFLCPDAETLVIHSRIHRFPHAHMAENAFSSKKPQFPWKTEISLKFRIFHENDDVLAKIAILP